MFTKIIVLELDFLKEAPIFPTSFFFTRLIRAFHTPKNGNITGKLSFN